MKHPLAIDLAELLDETPCGARWTLAHVACCEPCRTALRRLIQASPNYPDLYARPEDTPVTTPPPRKSVHLCSACGPCPTPDTCTCGCHWVIEA